MAASTQLNPPAAERKVALITGAARRVGAEIARVLQGAGIDVVLHYRGSAEAAHRLAETLNAQRTHSAYCVQGDLLQAAEVERVAEQAIAWRGRLDFLVNNASTFYATPLGRITHADWSDLMGSNLYAPLFLTQACAPELRRNQGAVVNLVDIHVLRPLLHYSVYCCAKAGLWTLTQALAQELAPEVRVNGVAPGAVLLPEAQDNAETHDDMVARTPLQRAGEPADVAGAVLFLLRDAPYITGQIVPVDGGRSVVE